MNEHKRRSRRTLVLAAGICILAISLAIALMLRNTDTTRPDLPRHRGPQPQRPVREYEPSGSQPDLSEESREDISRGTPVLKEEDGNAPSIPTNFGSEQYIDRATAVASLVKWAQRVETRTIVPIDIQDVTDLNGNACGLNVICTTKGDIPVDVRKIIAENTAFEDSKRKGIAGAYENNEEALLGNAIAEIMARRKRIIEEYGLVSYHLSLDKKSPPVLSFWPGLPFETVRYEPARSLAERELGKPIEDHKLVKYTCASSLICFKAADGDSIAIDPFNMKRVSLDVLRRVAERAEDDRDADREARIKKQWEEFLEGGVQ